MSDKFSNNGESQLNGSINDSVTSLVVDSASTFPTTGNFRIKIDDEILLVTAVSTNTFTVTRGAESTTAASHADNAPVYGVLTAGALNTILNGYQNANVGNYSQSLGGYDNNIGTYSSYTNYASAIVGGGENDIYPGSAAHVYYNAIVGGAYNLNRGDRSVILGGQYNIIHSTAKDCVVVGSQADVGGDSAGSGYPVNNAFIHGHYLFGTPGEAQFERHMAGVNATSSSTFHAYTVVGDNYDITLPPNYWATGTVKAIGVGTDGSSYHRIIHFAAANLGFGASILSQTTTEFSYDYGGSGPDCTLTSNYDTIHANCSGSDSFNVKWLVCWEFTRLYQTVSGSTS
jgi:hypothetical protein